MPNQDEDNFDLDSAVDDVTLDESNELLSDQDKEVTEAFIPDKNRSLKQKFKDFFKDLWQNPKKRWSLIVGTTVLLIAVFVVPPSRYFMLNTVGVRSSASITVLDESTSQPLKNVTVKLSGVEAKTDDDGIAKLEKLKLGNTQLVIQKRAFAETSKNITLGWGSNPLGEEKIKPVGVQYSFDVKDFLSGQPIEKAEAISGEYSAFSDEKGRVVLTIDQPGEDVIEITVKASNYRDEPVDQETEKKDVQPVAMVPARKQVFVSKRSGKYDVYQIDVDGKNEQLVLSGTGNERDDMSLVPSPDENMAALVSSRDSTRNEDGFLLSTLTLIDMNGNETTTESITKSERVQIIGWSGSQLVYVKIAEGASASTPDRHRLIVYNVETGESKEVAKTNYFNDVLMIGDDIYYAPSGAYQEGGQGLYKVNAKGENQKIVFNSEVWNLFRTDYDTVMFSVQADWYEYDLASSKVLAASGPPVAQVTRIYIDGPEKKRSLWVDQRDGKGALVAYDTESKEEKVVKMQSGLTYPVLWVSPSTVVYRINTDQETADYVVNINGGEPKKIVDVTNTGGIDKWYYY